MVERAYGVLTQKLLECGVSKEVYELDPESIYPYQDSLYDKGVKNRLKMTMSHFLYN